jgi:hypothetical protein
MNSPCGKLDDLMTSQEKARSGECQPKLPSKSLQHVAVDSLQEVAVRLQEEESFCLVENKCGNHADTDTQNSEHKGTKVKHTGKMGIKELGKGGGEIIGYVPIQVINLSLEEVELSKHMYVGFALPTEICMGNELVRVQRVHELRETKEEDMDRSEVAFEFCLNEKLGHLTEKDQNKLETILKKYCHIFYQEDSSVIGCTSIV